MPSTDTNPMAKLYERLGSVGFPRRYLREVVMPDWWEDEIAHNPAGYTEGMLFLSKNLGLDLSNIQNESVPVKFRNLGPCRFKKSSTTSEIELAIVRIIATRIVELISPAVQKEKIVLPTSATVIREAILSAGAPYVDLASLVDYCWLAGVPVIHLSGFPPGSKKMEGMAAKRLGRSAVVLSKKIDFEAWQLFILAHELGHIVLGHVGEEGVLVDEEVDRTSSDEEESAANSFALELLSGTPDLTVRAEGKANAKGLAKAASQAGKHEHIDPGHLVLNAAYRKGGDFFAVANAALKYLEPNPHAVDLLKRKLLQFIDAEKLPKETFAFILRVAGGKA